MFRAFTAQTVQILASFMCFHEVRENLIDSFLAEVSFPWFFEKRPPLAGKKVEPVKNFDLLLIRSKTCILCRSKA